MPQNKLYYGDNLDVLRKYVRDETIDLCYIDPPFNSKRNYNQIYNNIGGEDRAQAQAFVDTWTWDEHANECFEQILDNTNGVETRQSIELIRGLEKVLGKGSLFAYLVSMNARIAEIHRVLKATGSFYLHCDPTAGHYLKLVCDAIFCGGKGIFQSDIVWRRTTAHGNAKQGSKRFEVNFDTIFLYTKSESFIFNTSYQPFKDEQIEQQYNKFDEHGRRYRYVTPTAAKGGGDTSYEFHGVTPPRGRFWAYSKENMERFYEEGKLYFSGSGQPYIKYYLDERPGVAVMSFWDDIKPMSPTSKERLGYPTQKPEALLERIINASSNEGDTVLDAYCGCGTSVVVAQRLKRQWIGIDITYQSIALVVKRLEDSFGKDVTQEIELNGVPRDMESVKALVNKRDDRVRKEFEKWAVLTYSDNRAVINEKKGADKGIDGVAYVAIGRDEKKDIKHLPVMLSVKSGKVGASVVRDLRGVVEREGAAGGILLTLEEPTKPMLEEARQAGQFKGDFATFDRLQIVTVQQILDGERMRLPLLAEVAKRARSKSDAKQMGMYTEE
jgi:DNA modification methylase